MAKSKFPKQSVPRSLNEIQAQYSQLLSQSGNAQYLVHVYQNELNALNKQLVELNQEAAARQALDKKSEEEKNAQS